MSYDCCIIGAGIVGLATALSLLQRQPKLRILILEKERTVAVHQTGHNSGVLHSGIYYQPNSLKAQLCREGCAEMKRFCLEHGVPIDPVGKLIVATTQLEFERMMAIAQRAAQNGIAVERLNESELRQAEPNIVGLGALHVGSTAITDFRAVCQAMLALLIRLGAEARFGAEVIGIAELPNAVRIELENGDTVTTDKLVACAGLQSDRLARMVGLARDTRIVPFKGEYYTLPQTRSGLVKHLIYPVPDPKLPFLGVHLTRHINGEISVGPNAVLALSREGYGHYSLNKEDARNILGFRGFWLLARSNLGSGARELALSVSKRFYLNAVRKYCPSLVLGDLETYSAGIRAQAVSAQGRLIDDFHIVRSTRTLHVLNAPSPAATSALPIGRMIAEALGVIGRVSRLNR